MNVRDVLDVAISRERAHRKRIEEREKQIFLNKCLREISGEDAYHFLTHKACKALGGDGTYIAEPIYIIVDYYFNNQEHFDCSFEEWLCADNGPIFRHRINGLFPELECITSDKYEIAEMAKKFYGVEIEFDWEGNYLYSLEFNFKEINKKRVNLDEVKQITKNIVLDKLGGE